MACFGCGGDGGTSLLLCQACIEKKRVEREAKVAPHIVAQKQGRGVGKSRGGLQFAPKTILALTLGLLLVIGVAVSMLINPPHSSYRNITKSPPSTP